MLHDFQAMSILTLFWLQVCETVTYGIVTFLRCWVHDPRMLLAPTGRWTREWHPSAAAVANGRVWGANLDSHLNASPRSEPGAAAQRGCLRNGTHACLRGGRALISGTHPRSLIPATHPWSFMPCTYVHVHIHLPTFIHVCDRAHGIRQHW